MNELDSPYPLTDRQIERFWKDGFIKLERVYSREILEDIGPEITRLTLAHQPKLGPMSERSTYDKAFLQVMNLWERSPRVQQFVMGQRLGRIAAELLGVRGVRLYHDQSLYKEPGGGITPAHADQYYWPFDSDRVVTAWIPLQPVPLEMGPLGFYAGSQAVSFGRDLGISDESEARITLDMTRHGFDYCVEPFELGTVSFHLGWIFHKAGPNTSDSPRSVMTIIYMDSQMHLASNLNAVQRNDRDQWCPGAIEAEVIQTARNPVIWAQGG
jgi:ectoine hydroxylase-related dioxygenase (phytanoyl-CoA dioxygenase family)